MKADYYVLCNTFFLPLMMRYIKQTTPVIRTSTQVFSQGFNLESDKLALLNGLWTFVSPDSLPIVGKSVKFKNLYYNLGNIDADLSSHVRNANFIRDQIARDILALNNPAVKREPVSDPKDILPMRPARFLM
jgi:hypothetical protein